MANAFLKLGLAGARGRMGRTVAALVADRNDIALVSAYGRVDQTQHALAECEVIIDFSTAEAAASLAARAGAQGRPALVIGATGFTAAQDQTIKDASRRVAIIKSGNFSLGINLLAALVEQAADRLGPEDWDIEILEAHHRRKADAPSGTALMLGDAAARGRGAAVADRKPGARVGGTIGFASLRAGGIVGEHQVLIASEDEIITLGHSARDRAVFAKGAIAAALWVRGRPPGLYGMNDVLGF
jgi:4-hydroxy-tetrahydrodipicolinate reductase